MSRTAAVAFVLLIVPSALTAQERAAELAPGRTVRATLALSPGSRVPPRDRRVIGTLLDQRDGILVIRPEDGGVDLQLPVTRLERLEVRGCCTGSGGFLKGAAIGTAVALGGGLILQTLPSEAGPNMAIVGAALVGVPLGIVFGGLIGSRVFAGEGWIRVPVPGR